MQILCLEVGLEEGERKSAYGDGYPYYVKKEFMEYLSCGILAEGFSRVKCRECKHELVVAHSCKNRGICPSCVARRMADTSAYLVDILLPDASYRQWVFTFPFALRYFMAKEYRLITKILGIVIHAVFCWQRKEARRRGYIQPI